MKNKHFIFAILCILVSTLVYASDFSNDTSCELGFHFKGSADDFCGSNDGSVGSGVTTGVTGISKSDGSWGDNEAFEFTNTSDTSQVTVPSSNSINPSSSDFTYAAWMKIKDTGDAQEILSKRDPNNGGKGYRIVAKSDGTLQCTFDDGSTFVGVDSTNSGYNDNNWYHVVCVRDSDTMRLFIDGSEDNTGSINTNNISTSQDLFIGESTDSNGFQVEGKIDEIRFFSKSLSSSEVSNLKNCNYISGGCSTSSKKPSFSNPSPSNNEVNVSKTTFLQINISDSNNNSLSSVDFFFGNNTLIESKSSVSTGKVVTDNLNLEVGRNYNWFVNASDGDNTSTSNIYNFRTKNWFENPECDLGFSFNESSGSTIDHCGKNSGSTSSISYGVDGINKSVGNWSGDNAYDFDGSSSEVLVSDDPTLDYGTGNFTISLWVKPVSSFSEFKYVLEKRDEGESGLGYRVGVLDTGEANCAIDDGPNFSGVSGSTDLTDNNWHHIVCSRKDNNLTLWVDGNQAGSSSATTSSLSNDEDLRIGHLDSGNVFNGSIDELKIYNESLQSSDVSNLYSKNQYYGFDTSNKPPTISNADPDGLNNESINASLSFKVDDNDDSTLSWAAVIWKNGTIISNTTNPSAGGKITAQLYGLSYNSTFEWQAAVSDGSTTSYGGNYSFSTDYDSPVKENFSVIFNADGHYALDKNLVELPNEPHDIFIWRDADDHGIDTSAVLKMATTPDFGQTRNNVTTIYDESGVDVRDQEAIRMSDGRVGILAARDDGNNDLNPVFVYSDDKGETWSNKTISTAKNMNVVHSFIKFPSCAGGDDDGGYIAFQQGGQAGDSIRYVSTTDYGSSWAVGDAVTSDTSVWMTEPTVEKLPNQCKYVMIMRNEKYENSTALGANTTDLTNWNGPYNTSVRMSGNPPEIERFDGDKLWWTAPSRTTGNSGIKTFSDSILHQTADIQDVYNDLSSWSGWKKFSPGLELNVGYTDIVTIDGQNVMVTGINESDDDTTAQVGLFTGPANNTETVDTTPPAITIDHPTNTTYSSKSGYEDLNVTSSETVDTWKYNIDGGSNTTFTPNTTISGLSDGQHTVNVYANDTNGNTGSESVTFTVDTSAPSADFSFTPSNPNVSETIDFDGSSSSDNLGISTFRWDFQNDGVTDTTGEQVQNSYSSEDNYTVELEVEDEAGNTDTTTKTVEVLGQLSVQEKGFVVQACSDTPFCITNITEFPNPVDYVSTAIESSFEDAWKVNTTGNAGDSWNVTSNFTNTNPYVGDAESNTVTVNIKDSSSSSNLAPTASFTTSTTDLTVDVDASGSSDSDGSISQYEWDWTSDGTYEDTGETASHTYGSDGDYTITLRVTDDDGAQDTSSKTVSVSDSTNDGGDGGSGGGGGGGSGGDSGDTVEVNGSSGKLLTPQFQTRYHGVNSVYLENGTSTTLTINGNEHILELVDVLNDSAADIRVDGNPRTELQGDSFTVDSERVGLSDIVNDTDYPLATFDISDATSYGYLHLIGKYKINDSGTVELQYRETGFGNSWQTGKTYSHSSDQNLTLVNYTTGVETGIYEARLRLNTSNDTLISGPNGFIVGSKTPSINVTDPRTGDTIQRPNGPTMEVSLNYEGVVPDNSSSKFGQYYYRNGKVYDEGEKDSVTLTDQQTIFEEIVEFFGFTETPTGRLIAWLVPSEGTSFEVESTMVIPTDYGDYVAYANASSNETGNDYNATSIGQVLTVERQSFEEYVGDESKDGDTTIGDTGDRNETVSDVDGDGTNETIGNLAWSLDNPDNGSTVQVDDLSTSSINFDLYTINENGTLEINKSMYLNSTGFNKEFKLNPRKTSHSIDVNSTNIGNDWKEDQGYNYYVEFYYPNGSTVVTSLNYSNGTSTFQVEKDINEQAGLIENLITGKFVETIQTVWNFDKSQVKNWTGILSMFVVLVAAKLREKTRNVAGILVFLVYLFFSPLFLDYLSVFTNVIVVSLVSLFVVLKLIRGEVTL